MPQSPKIYTILQSLRDRLRDEDIDPPSIAILMPKADFDRWRDEVRRESDAEPNGGSMGFSYGGFTFLDGSCFVYARKDVVH